MKNLFYEKLCRCNIIYRLKKFLGGILIAIANIIQGVSVGTIIVILGLFDKITGFM